MEEISPVLYLSALRPYKRIKTIDPLCGENMATVLALDGCAAHCPRVFHGVNLIQWVHLL